MCARFSPVHLSNSDALFASRPAIAGRGDRALARWAGRLIQRFSWRFRIFLIARAPSTMLRMVPLLRYRGGGCATAFPRCDLHPSFCSSGTKVLPRTDGRHFIFIYLPWKTREAERRTAHLRYPHLKEMRARSFATARLSALLRGYALRFVTPTRPGPRFLESPDANGRTLSDASAAGILQSDHAPDGAMPKPLANKSDWLSSARTAPAPSIGVTGRCP